MKTCHGVIYIVLENILSTTWSYHQTRKFAIVTRLDTVYRIKLDDHPFDLVSGPPEARDNSISLG